MAPSVQASKPAPVSSPDFRESVVQGLDAPSRNLPSKFFYDEIGSALFDRICELDEYYPTRTESQIMVTHAAAMASKIGDEVRLIEYGSGSSLKTRVLLDHLADPITYVPVDISAGHLIRTADQLASEYPRIEVTPIVADFTKKFALPEPKVGTNRNCIYFPGSTIGNFSPWSAVELLDSMAEIAGPEGGMLIGFDLQKDIDVLERAYNDAKGVTAQFNKNLLQRINRELGADFDLAQFEHLAFYNRPAARIEMHLVSQCEQSVTIGCERFQFGWGESIVTEYSHKYTVEGFAELASEASWRCEDVWTDPNRHFAVMHLER